MPNQLYKPFTFEVLNELPLGYYAILNNGKLIEVINIFNIVVKRAEIMGNTNTYSLGVIFDMFQVPTLQQIVSIEDII